MPWKLHAANASDNNDAVEVDIQRLFDDDGARGEFIILEAPDGSFVQAAGEGDGPYVLEWSRGHGDDPMRAVGEFDKENVRTCFLAFFHNEKGWRDSWTWTRVESGNGCASIIVIGFSVIAAIVHGVV